MKSFDEFKTEIQEAIDKKPANWRKGQTAFNAVEEKYGTVAREVQFEDNVDCFYDDSYIDSFLICVYKRLIKQKDPDNIWED